MSTKEGSGRIQELRLAYGKVRSAGCTPEGNRILRAASCLLYDGMTVVLTSVYLHVTGSGPHVHVQFCM